MAHIFSAEASNGKARKTEGHSEEAWNTHYPTIRRLYLENGNNLKEVRSIMQERYDFRASVSMYRKRFRKWNISKNWTSGYKAKLLDQVSSSVTPLSVSFSQLNEKDQRRLKRYLRTMKTASLNSMQRPELSHGSIASLPENRHMNSSGSHDETFPGANQWVFHCGGNMNGGSGKVEILSEWMGNIEGISIIDEGPEDFSLPLPTLYTTITLNPTSLSTEWIMMAVHISYSSVDSIAAQAEAASRSKFWDHLDQAIYLLKINSTPRAFTEIGLACDEAASEIVSRPLDFVSGLFSTLSWENTVVCPEVRLHLLWFIARLARSKFDPSYPLAILARALIVSGHQENLSQNVLFSILNQLEKSLGPEHEATINATNTVTMLLRRSHKYVEAVQNAEAALVKVTSLYGKRSLQVRVTARQLEHVYMDTGSWSKALTVCMDIVDERLPDGLPSVSTQKDECALHTMEDIAKIYNHLGDNDKSISWLTLAATAASSLFGVSVKTIHIFDKLENLLVEQGRYREAELLWAAGVY
ncbi:hypothetical protein AB5N19_05926 [Seiridium cardinale]